MQIISLIQKTDLKNVDMEGNLLTNVMENIFRYSIVQTCSTSLNCASDAGNYLNCSCVLDSSALKYCQADFGDDEWRVSIAAKVPQDIIF
jgi:hypothetical protein